MTPLLVLLTLGCSSSGSCDLVPVGSLSESERSTATSASMEVAHDLEGEWTNEADGHIYSLNVNFPAMDDFVVDVGGGDCKASLTPVAMTLASESVALDSPGGGCALGGTGVDWVGVTCELESEGGAVWEVFAEDAEHLQVFWADAAMGDSHPATAVLEQWTAS